MGSLLFSMGNLKYYTNDGESSAYAMVVEYRGLEIKFLGLS